MSYRLNGRISKLEEQLNPSDAGRMHLICLNDGESDQDAIARHGINPKPHDMVVIFQYGKCPGCEGTGA